MALPWNGWSGRLQAHAILSTVTKRRMKSGFNHIVCSCTVSWRIIHTKSKLYVMTIFLRASMMIASVVLGT